MRLDVLQDGGNDFLVGAQAFKIAIGDSELKQFEITTKDVIPRSHRHAHVVTGTDSTERKDDLKRTSSALFLRYL